MIHSLRRRYFLTLLLPMLLAGRPAGASAQSPSAAPLRVDVLDVGQGDSVLVRSPEGKTMLVDAGPSQAVVGRLREQGVTAIDLVVVSHHHSDHYGGMEAVVRVYKPRYFIATNSAHATPSYLKLLRAVRDSGATTLRPAGAARKIELGSVQITVLPQPPADPDEENNNSIGLRVQLGAFALLMTGDSEVGERQWWRQNCPELLRDCALLKLAHHGSRNGTDAAWLALVNPRLTIASLGAGNDYGHPHPETLTLLRRAGIPLLRTDQRGTVSVTSDGTRWEVRSTSLASRSPSAATTAPNRPKPGRGEDGPLDLNTASAADLETIPGIGPATARKIIEARPFRSIEDLRRLPGLGAARLAEIRPRVVVR